MSKIYPDTGVNPIVFAAASPTAGSRQAFEFNTDAPGDPNATMFLTFVVFFYPNAHNEDAAPKVPDVELQTDTGSWQPLSQTTSGPLSLQIVGGSVNYSFAPLGAKGVYRLRFNQDQGDFNNKSWAIRFTMTDPSINAANMAGLTFVVAPDEALLPWIAAPGQGRLLMSGAPPLDFGAALEGLTLAGPTNPEPKKLIMGRTYSLSVPIGNYGPGPLKISGVSPASVNHMSLSGPTPLVLPPGAMAMLSASFAAPQTVSAAIQAAFTVASDDPLGGVGGGSASAHLNAIVLNASTMAPFAYVANFNSDSVSVLDTITNQLVAQVAVDSNPVGVAVAMDGKRVYVAGQSVSVIDVATNTRIAQILVQGDWIAVAPDGKRAYVTNDGRNNVSVIDTASHAVAATIPVGKNPRGLAVAPDGTKVYVTNRDVNSVSVIDTAANQVTSSVSVGVKPIGIAVTPDGKRAYVANVGSNNISVIDTTTNVLTATIPVEFSPSGVAIAPDGKTAYVTNSASGTVSIIKTDSSSAARTVAVGAEPIGIAVTPDGKRVYVANDGDNTVSVIDTTTNGVTTFAVGLSPEGIGIIPPPPGVPQ